MQWFLIFIFHEDQKLELQKLYEAQYLGIVSKVSGFWKFFFFYDSFIRYTLILFPKVSVCLAND